jgi:hypothetical protein
MPLTTEQSPEAMRFLEELVAVCRKHNRSLSHEDGCFVVMPAFTKGMGEWLLSALELSDVAAAT